jgi:hypothetical protein
MVNSGQLFIAEKGGELFKIGEIAPQGVRRNVSLVSEVGEEVVYVLPHEDTVAYQTGFCKRRRKRECGMRNAECGLHEARFYCFFSAV